MGAFLLVCPVGFNPLIFLLFQGDKNTNFLSEEKSRSYFISYFISLGMS